LPIEGGETPTSTEPLGFEEIENQVANISQAVSKLEEAIKEWLKR